MKKYLLAIGVFLSSCTNVESQEKSIFGKYTSIKMSKIQRLVLSASNFEYTSGSSLTLNLDSTFVYETCAQIGNGVWYAKNDSIYLFCQNVRYKIDSFNYLPQYKKGTQCSEKPTIYKIKKEGIVNIFKTKNNVTVQEYLSKID